ncbi:hypothetical protein K488DRAFT_75211 [Vararia minispora EC-137]|uniref:Uncharacterized protein n=1 Tax=Vararia minispora EC-137 TaxID=1314806 RepID=A0ACB8Q4W8_9AGAM|nr:hypothetical protein K488DRAFT_75211 [Vararia minispora EC-137]
MLGAMNRVRVWAGTLTVGEGMIHETESKTQKKAADLTGLRENDPDIPKAPAPKQLGSYSSGQVKDTWATLHIVCRSWYEIMISQGGIASDIRVTNDHWDVDFALHLLERSFHAPLHLTLLLDNAARNRYTIMEAEAFIETAMRDHRARIRTLVVGRSGIRTDICEQLLRAHLPDLHNLSIGPDLTKCPSLDLDDLSEVTPVLTSLSIASSVRLNPTASEAGPIFLNVTRIQLSGSPSLFDTTVVSWDFMTIVGRLPALKELVLSDYFPESPASVALQPVSLPANMDKLEYRSSKPAYCIMVIDSLLVHDGVHRAVSLERADPRTLATIFTGAHKNSARRVQTGKGDAKHETGKHQLSTDEARTKIAIIIDREHDVVELRLVPDLSPSTSGTYYVRASRIYDSLVHLVAGIPLHTMRDMQVRSDQPMEILWRYVSLSRTLDKINVEGRTAHAFLKVFAQDARKFPALRHVCIASWRSADDEPTNYDDAATTLHTALVRRSSTGLPALDTIDVPWSRRVLHRTRLAYFRKGTASHSFKNVRDYTAKKTPQFYGEPDERTYGASTSAPQKGHADTAWADARHCMRNQKRKGEREETVDTILKDTQERATPTLETLRSVSSRPRTKPLRMTTRTEPSRMRGIEHEGSAGWRPVSTGSEESRKGPGEEVTGESEMKETENNDTA